MPRLSKCAFRLPQVTARALAVSILSMLSSAREKGLPPDNCNREWRQQQRTRAERWFPSHES